MIQRLPGFLIIGFILYAAWRLDPELADEVFLGLAVILCGFLFFLSMLGFIQRGARINPFAVVGLAVSGFIFWMVLDQSVIDILAAAGLGIFFALMLGGWFHLDRPSARRTPPWERDWNREIGKMGASTVTREKRPSSSTIDPWGNGPTTGNASRGWDSFCRDAASGLFRSASSDRSGEIVIRSGQDAQYMVKGAINGVGVTFVIDTGASIINIPEGLARRMGLRPHGWGVSNTPEGDVRVQEVILDEVALGEIRVRRLRAHIMPRMDPDIVLLGMSFLNHTHFSYHKGVMTIRPAD